MDVSTGEQFWSEETYRIFDYDPTLKPTVQLALERIYPEGLPLVQQVMASVSDHGSDEDIEHRLLMPDGSVKTIRVLGNTSHDRVGKPTFLGAITDISTIKNAFEEIQRLKDQLYKENLALREEIDVTMMFEEIVGLCKSSFLKFLKLRQPNRQF